MKSPLPIAGFFGHEQRDWKSPGIKRLRFLGLLPTWVTIGVLMIGPLLIMAAVSLMEANVYGGVHLRFDMSSYVQILFDKNLFDETEFNPPT